ncbi:uncharacterized protein LOC129952255 isoform X2 [Eupeodes corollae]|uniref:uncharacterized protein LOC129952255 isoform X2 n=1 Tax=Eupeodes corollae TaxID=290404 RepID=UPI002490E9F1|nr:uncharacterized protein LOC129952255 isoform X2 [Eupeodes corollae]
MSSKSLPIDSMEKWAIVLGLPHQSAYNALPKVDRPLGLPINALPGWESIPLHSKLPMLKCPNNQVIFSKNKIGRSHENSKRDFDSVCLNAKMDYNPLHDPHLGRFYSNEKLLKRLRQNGEITESNDVICTLKEFNEHRISLHETYISFIRTERKKIDEELQDVHLISHAEKIADQENTSSKIANCYGDVLRRKAELSKQRAQRNQTMLKRIYQKELKIKSQRTMEAEVLRHKKELNNFRITHILNAAIDLQRKRRIALKKHLQHKSDMVNNNIKLTKEKEKQLAKEKAEISWMKHLKERIMKHEKFKQIIKDNDKDIRDWVANHMAQYKHKWFDLEQQLKNRCSRKKGTKKKIQKRKIMLKKIRESLVKTQRDHLKSLTSEDIRDAIHTAIDIKNPHKRKQYDTDDYIYKAAKYILEEVLANFNKDLSDEKDVADVISARISRLFTEVKQYVLKRAIHIITTDTTSAEQKKTSFNSARNHRRYSLGKGVSFNSISILIGTGSYALGEDIKFTSERLPTPAGSLTSVIIDADDDDESSDDTNDKQRKTLHYLSRGERIFIEHLYIKFKRELIVGVGKQVLTAIELHKKNKILKVRKKLQDIDKNFLVKLMTRSILSFAVNNCNFHSYSLLCQYSLAGDIILFLQTNVLKPKRDPRVIAQPHTRCVSALAPPFSTYYK